MSLNEFEQLLKKYDEGSCTPEEAAWVEEWIKTNNLRSQSEWKQLSTGEKQAYLNHLYVDIKRAATPVNDTAPLVEYDAPTRTTSIQWLWPTAVAACVAVFVLFYVSKRSVDEVQEPVPVTWSTLSLESGQRKKVTLADGTIVWLQGGSVFSYPETFDSTVRVVELLGEGFLEVASDEQKPFILKTQGLELEVLGTSFNVKSFPELSEQVISLVEGKLAVRAVDSLGNVENQVLLHPEESAIFSLAARQLIKSDMPVLVNADAFKAGSLQFDDTPLDDVLFRISKAFGVTIHYDNEKAKASRQKINASFSLAEPVKEVLQSVARSTGSRLIWNNDRDVEFRI